jgi:hypothetical protein
MQGDLAIDLRESDGTAGLPVLTPVAVVAEADVDQLVRTARAGVAMLSLQLRTAVNDAAAAEVVDEHVDLSGAHDLARASLDRYVADRRRELAEELEQARADAAFTVTAARTEAAELVAAASEETRRLLLAGVTPLPVDGPPSLRVVPDGGETVVVPDEPSARELTAPMVETETAPPQVGAVPPAAEVAAPLAAGVALAATPAEVSVLAPPALPVDVLPVVQPAPAGLAAHVPAHAATGAAVEQPARRGLSRFRYRDVVLPMIAVLVVLVVLLAWVG